MSIFISMEATIDFDKQMYQPGDKVITTFQCFKPFPANLNKIELYVQSGEITKVTYTTSSGKSSTRRTAVQETVYSEASDIIQIDENTSNINIELTYQLPEDNIPPIGSLNELEVFHRAWIKYDISRGRDDHLLKNIPYQIVPETDNKRRTVQEEKLIVESSHSICFLGDEVTLHLSPIETVNCRGYRVEFVRKQFREAHRHRTNEEKKIVLARLQDLHEFPTTVKIPDLHFSTAFGTNYSIDYFLKIVVDKERARDINVEVPIIYFPKRKEQYLSALHFENEGAICSECGDKQEIDAVFCINCGVKL